jgi:hypothetical protein
LSSPPIPTGNLHGDLTGLLALATNRNGPLHESDPALQQIKVVATNRGQLNLPKNKSRLGKAADVADLAQQVKLVVGERNQLNLLLRAAA